MTEHSAASQPVEFDWVVIGSGFGGSVSALRLAEKGYSVCVLECGRRFTDEELPETLWDLKNGYWMPKLGLRGITRLSFFRNVCVVSGCGVGGGSLTYGNTLYRAGDRFRAELARIQDEPAERFDAYYELAERMLGAITVPHESVLDTLARETATDLGYGDSWQQARVGVFYGDEPGKTVPDPYFGGEGPDRTGCIECGNCCLGCRYGAKNNLRKNYLWLAERRGVAIVPERLVTDIRPLGVGDGSEGYELSTCDPGSVTRRTDRVFRARGVVVSGGAVGTNLLLANCRARGSLARLSDQLGHHVRSNAEATGAVTARDPNADFTHSVALTSSVFPSHDQHIVTATYGPGGDSFGLNFVPLTGNGNRIVRPLKVLLNVLRRPRDFANTKKLIGYSRRTVYVVGMQQTPGAVQFRAKRRLLGSGVRLSAMQDPAHPTPTFLPEVNRFVAQLAKRIDGIPQSWGTEALAAMPLTAHLIGGAVTGTSPETGVVDAQHRVFGYHNLLVADASTLPFNPGYNPSLTITAMAERAMTFIPPADSDGRPSSSVAHAVGD